MEIYKKILSFFKGKENKIINDFQEVKGKCTSTIEEMPHSFYLEFIDYVKNRFYSDIERISKFEYNEKIGDFEYLLKKAIENEDLKYADNYEKLYLLKIPELKEILKFYKLKVNGKKDELIERIKENIETDKLKKLVPEEKAIVLTQKSKVSLKKYKDKVKSEKIEMETETLSLIYNTFNKNIVDSNLDKYKLYDRSDLFKSNTNIENIENLELWKNYFKVISQTELKDLKNNAEFQKRLKAVIIYCAVYGGFLRFSLDNIILSFLGEEILNPHLDEILLKMGYSKEKINNKLRLERYIKYYILFVLRQSNLKSLKEAGIEKIGILKYSDECYLHTGKEIYNLKTDEIPELPTDYCCDCEYMML